MVSLGAYYRELVAANRTQPVRQIDIRMILRRVLVASAFLKCCSDYKIHRKLISAQKHFLDETSQVWLVVPNLTNAPAVGSVDTAPARARKAHPELEHKPCRRCS